MGSTSVRYPRSARSGGAYLLPCGQYQAAQGTRYRAIVSISQGTQYRVRVCVQGYHVPCTLVCHMRTSVPQAQATDVQQHTTVYDAQDRCLEPRVTWAAYTVKGRDTSFSEAYTLPRGGPTPKNHPKPYLQPDKRPLRPPAPPKQARKGLLEHSGTP